MTQLTDSLFRTIAFARITEVIPSISDPSVSPVKGAFMALMLPSIHILNVVSVLDDALSEYIDLKNISWPSMTKRDLCNRIDVVSSVVPGINITGLHRVRKLRNAVAHPDGAAINQSVTWTALNEAFDIVLQTFLALGQIEATPNIVAFYEREPTLYLDALGPDGERMRQKHRIGAKLNDIVFLEYIHEINYFPPIIHDSGCKG